jgi:DNA helicase-2/ATP-dependent DNA helicase PcrA
VNPDDLLAELDPEQREVALALRGPVRVLAGAGTGKTRAITHRIAYGVASGVYTPTEVLAVTFTTRAAGEMRSRLRALGAPGVQARTFHAAALRQVRYFWPKVYGGDAPILTESKLPLVGRAAKGVAVSTNRGVLRDLASEIEWAKVSNVRPEDYLSKASKLQRTVSDLEPSAVAAVYDAYEMHKSAEGRMDMEDVLLLAAAILSEDERTAAMVRGQYKHLVVDEYQDVNPIQQTLLGLWLGGSEQLCVVGDPAQTIYSFAGARADYLLDFTKRYPQATQVELVRNYRSSPQIVATANALLDGAQTRSVKLQAVGAPGPDVGWHRHADEVAEADAVVEQIQHLRGVGIRFGDMAVLFRINAQSEHLEEALSQADIPYTVRGAARFFERQEVRQAIALLRGQVRGGVPAQASLGEQVAEALSSIGWSPKAPEARGQVRDRWESLQALLDLAVAFAAQGAELGLEGFLAELDRRTTEQHAPSADSVTLATIHTAKGLEWEAVFVVGVQEGSLPITYAQDPTAVEEERRLLYVGLTRAKRHLSVSWAAARAPGQPARRRHSRFIANLIPGELVPASTVSGKKTSTKKRSRKVTNCRVCNVVLADAKQRNRGRCDDCPVPYDEELFERLRSWRLQRATEDEVPAYVVFSDATLEALAEVAPLTKEALLEISGVGPAKVERYGQDVLQILAEAATSAT